MTSVCRARVQHLRPGRRGRRRGLPAARYPPTTGHIHVQNPGSYEKSVRHPCLQGYLAHKEYPPPKTLQ